MYLDGIFKFFLFVCIAFVLLFYLSPATYWLSGDDPGSEWCYRRLVTSFVTQIQKVAHEMLEGHQRAIMGNMTVEVAERFHHHQYLSWNNCRLTHEHFCIIICAPNVLWRYFLQQCCCTVCKILFKMSKCHQRYTAFKLYFVMLLVFVSLCSSSITTHLSDMYRDSSWSRDGLNLSSS